MSSVLDSIIVGVREDLEIRKKMLSQNKLQQLASQAPAALPVNFRQDTLSVISEIKRKSPAKGDIAEIASPETLAQDYLAGGATAISVLTENRRFNGSLADFTAVRKAVKIPMLRKDFIVDEYQIFESKFYGADIILLIVAALDAIQLRDYLILANELGITSLVETHTAAEVDIALSLNAKIVGVNNRDLRTLAVDLSQYQKLAKMIPDETIKIAESGIFTIAQAQQLRDCGADAILVGEALVRHANPKQAVADFRALS